MCGVLGWHPNTIWELTYKTLVVAHDAKLVEQWNHTALLATIDYNLYVLTHNINSKNHKIQPLTYFDFHPYLEKPRRGIRITKSNFKTLKTLAGHMVRR